MSALYDSVIAAIADIAATRDLLVSDEAIAKAIIQGPAAGPTSIVVTANGNVFTLARVLASLGIGYKNAVVDYGVDNTGVTPVAASLQTAMNSAAAANKPFYIPYGSYNVDDVATAGAIKVPSGLQIIGEGPTKSVLTRSNNAEVGTVEFNNTTGASCNGIGINFTNSSFVNTAFGAAYTTKYRLGYAQCGFSIRNGSNDILLDNCRVTGPINRAFQIMNSADVWINRCTGIGNGDAGLRIVSDALAGIATSVYSGSAQIPDETNIIAIDDVRITDCIFSGATTLRGSTLPTNCTTNAGVAGTFGQFYGINIATVNDSTDLIRNLFISNTTARYTDVQGFELGGALDSPSLIGCKAYNIGSRAPTTQGIALLIQALSSSQRPSNITIDDFRAYSGQRGIFILGVVGGAITDFMSDANNIAMDFGNQFGSDCAAFSITGAKISNGTGTSTGINADHLTHSGILNSIITTMSNGIALTANSSKVIVSLNQVYGNTSTQITDSGTGNSVGSNIIA